MSSANNQVFGNDVTVVDATQVYPLGTERLVLASQSGTGSDQVWRYVKNNTAAAFALGEVVMADATTTSGGTAILATQDAPKDRILGVAQSYTTAGSALTTLGAGAYGWVLAHGYGTVKAAAAGAVSNDTPISVGATAGAVYDSPNSVVGAKGVCGYCHVTILAGATGTAWIDCR